MEPTDSWNEQRGVNLSETVFGWVEHEDQGWGVPLEQRTVLMILLHGPPGGGWKSRW